MLRRIQEVFCRGSRSREDLIEAAAARHGIEPNLVRAVIQVESGGNTWATRFEPEWKYFLEHRNPQASAATERMQQATSWGLMQVMGTVARENGFDGPFLATLCDPETGLEYGCRLLAKLRRRYPGKPWSAVAAYNAGSARFDAAGRFTNQAYVDKVQHALDRLEGFVA